MLADNAKLCEGSLGDDEEVDEGFGSSVAELSVLLELIFTGAVLILVRPEFSALEYCPIPPEDGSTGDLGGPELQIEPEAGLVPIRG